MQDFESLLEGSVEVHGHLCPGQVVGVRMAMLGCRLIGLDEPTCRDQIKKLIVFVEMDRCTADAVAYVTGVKLGRRSLKFMDYGIMAATFVNLHTDKVYRVISTEEARDLAPIYAPEATTKTSQQLEAYKRMPDSVLFRVQKVGLKLTEFDMPGPTRSKVICSHCGQIVRDRREVIQAGHILCKPCTSDSYFTGPEDITWPDMNWTPGQSTPNLPELDPVENHSGIMLTPKNENISDSLKRSECRAEKNKTKRCGWHATGPRHHRNSAG